MPRRASGGTLAIGSGSAYANDRLAPAAAMADSGRVSYIGFDCLAERTMALAHVRRRRNPASGQDEVERARTLTPAARLDGVPGGPDPRQGGAAHVVDHPAGHAVLDQRQRPLGCALGIERARKRRAEEGRVGEVDRRRGDVVAEALDEGAAALRVGEPVERGHAEQLEQAADGARLQHDRIVPGRQLGRLPLRERLGCRGFSELLNPTWPR